MNKDICGSCGEELLFEENKKMAEDLKVSICYTQIPCPCGYKNGIEVIKFIPITPARYINFTVEINGERDFK